MSKEGKSWTAKILMKSNTTRYVTVENKKVKDLIITAKRTLENKKESNKGGMLMPVEMWVVKAVLENMNLSGGKLEQIVCIEVEEKKKGEESVVSGLA